MSKNKEAIEGLKRTRDRLRMVILSIAMQRGGANQADTILDNLAKEIAPLQLQLEAIERAIEWAKEE